VVEVVGGEGVFWVKNKDSRGERFRRALNVNFYVRKA